MRRAPAAAVSTTPPITPSRTARAASTRHRRRSPARRLSHTGPIQGFSYQHARTVKDAGITAAVVLPAHRRAMSAAGAIRSCLMAAGQRPSNADPSIRTSPHVHLDPADLQTLADLRGLTGGRGSCAGRFCLRRADVHLGRESALKSGTLATSSPSRGVAQRRGMDIACESCRRSDRCAHITRSGAAQAATLGDPASVQIGGSRAFSEQSM